MNRNDIGYWDAAQLRTIASRERAKALHEMRLQFSAWLRSLLPAGTARARECLDCGG